MLGSQTGIDELLGSTAPALDVAIYPFHLDLLLPFMQPLAHFVDRPEDADFILSMNEFQDGGAEALANARHWGKPIAWWSTEDPNHFQAFLPQAAQADFVFTTDEACIPDYQARLGHERVFWLPWACSPHIHRPLPLHAEATDFVLSANWYVNEARRWGIETVIEPLLQAGYSLTHFSYAYSMWPDKYRRYWRGESSCYDVAEQYRYGRVALGLNNQRSWMDGFGMTYMTSMRTFEVLACGKPFLTMQSDAYARLGMVNGEHLVWVERAEDTLNWATRLLESEGGRIADAGRQFVLTHHTYAHRLRQIAQAVLG